MDIIRGGQSMHIGGHRYELRDLSAISEIGNYSMPTMYNILVDHELTFALTTTNANGHIPIFSHRPSNLPGKLSYIYRYFPYRCERSYIQLFIFFSLFGVELTIQIQHRLCVDGEPTICDTRKYTLNLQWFSTTTNIQYYLSSTFMAKS